MEIPNRQQVQTPSLINQRVADAVSGEMSLRNVYVKGEVVNLSRSTCRNGTPAMYFGIKDDRSVLPCVRFGTLNRQVDMRNGAEIICRGDVGVYVPFGKYQLNIVDIYEAGEGEDARALAEVKRRIHEEGLDTRKRPLPKYPKKIAVVTSANGDALADITQNIKPRYPLVTIQVISANVQGANAVDSLISGIEKAQNVGADLIIFGRGGGGQLDLNAFNDERLARAVFASRIPTISAIGHTKNDSLCDMVSDLKVATPTQAAEKSTPDIKEILKDIDNLCESCKASVKRVAAKCKADLSVLEKGILLGSPKGRINTWRARLESLETRIDASARNKLVSSRNRLQLAAQAVSNLNPLAILSRGYAVVKKDGKAVKSSEELKAGDVVEIKLGKGEAVAEIKEIKS